MATLILPGLYQISLGYAHAYIVDEGGELVLVDTGLPGRREHILAAIADIGRRQEDLRHIVVTHCHPDHMGSLKELKEATGAITYAHADDAPYIGGLQRPPTPALGSLGGALQKALALLTPRPSPVAVDVVLSDGDTVGPAELHVVHTPGHTPGHICLLWERHGGVLFIGDAAVNVLGLRPPPALFTVDMEQAKESLRRIASLEFQTACFGHGAVLKGRAHAAFRHLVERLAR